jgi:hypothetical protein
MLVRTALEIALPIAVWIAFAALASDNFKDSSEAKYFLILPFMLVGVCAVLVGIIAFIGWLY